jgi:hypothetical protein
MFLHISTDDGFIVINKNEVVSLSNQNNDVRVEMTSFKEQIFIKNRDVKDVLDMFADEEMIFIEESNSELMIRKSAMLSINQEKHCEVKNSRISLKGKHFHSIKGISAIEFYTKYIS